MKTNLMKNLVIMFALALTALPSVAQTTKLGHIDRQKLMLLLPERLTAETKMQGFAKTLDDRLKAMGAEYQAKVADVQSRADAMTQTEKDVAVREIGELEQRIQSAQQKAQEDLDKQEEELLKPMVDRTNAAISEVAAANGFTYIFDTSTGFVLYYDKGEDIIDLVKAKLGVK
ncbi:MAG TPA: OmpH family outer membrane protein [Flavobacteriales bacterium]|jgi:outer membrane protein|nr:OmpH family outer membrane protein [Flavobacteriales bacterium]MBP6644164.1 OmpH family outer membrane protein [Flavobacteriales bacterium]HQV76688.1 OmpH family outer membrane protein [Flavobacteriales bacterium]HQW40055.1 OmpH family outer membrane protein [Flavobacteriales bacterium]